MKPVNINLRQGDAVSTWPSGEVTSWSTEATVIRTTISIVEETTMYTITGSYSTVAVSGATSDDASPTATPWGNSTGSVAYRTGAATSPTTSPISSEWPPVIGSTTPSTNTTSPTTSYSEADRTGVAVPPSTTTGPSGTTVYTTTIVTIDVVPTITTTVTVDVPCPTGNSTTLAAGTGPLTSEPVTSTSTIYSIPPGTATTIGMTVTPVAVTMTYTPPGYPTPSAPTGTGTASLGTAATSPVNTASTSTTGTEGFRTGTATPHFPASGSSTSLLVLLALLRPAHSLERKATAQEPTNHLLLARLAASRLRASISQRPALSLPQLLLRHLPGRAIGQAPLPLLILAGTRPRPRSPPGRRHLQLMATGLARLLLLSLSQATARCLSRQARRLAQAREAELAELLLLSLSRATARRLSRRAPCRPPARPTGLASARTT